MHCAVLGRTHRRGTDAGDQPGTHEVGVPDTLREVLMVCNNTGALNLGDVCRLSCSSKAMQTTWHTMLTAEGGRAAQTLLQGAVRDTAAANRSGRTWHLSILKQQLDWLLRVAVTPAVLQHAIAELLQLSAVPEEVAGA